jgi:glycosyltransferase involved in cell wall biosynthesis
MEPQPTAERPTGPGAAGGLSICVVTETYPPEVNGVAMTLERLVRGLGARGHRMSVIRPRQPADGAEAPSDNGVRTALIPALPLPMYRELRFGVVGRGTFERLWRDDRPDVLYVATEGPAGNAAVRQAARMGIPAVSGFHSKFDHFSRFYHLGLLQGTLFRYLRALHNRTRCTVVPTRALRAELEAGGFRNVRVVARGVDCRLFTPARRDGALRASWGLGDGAPGVLFVSRLAPEKSPEVAVAAFRAIQVVAPSARLAMVGDGPARRGLERANPDVVFCGMQRGETLAAHYASADVLLFPSEIETFGNVTLEAMASGLGVVAYDYAAAATHIVHGKNGMKAPTGDRAAFAEAACELLHTPDLLPETRRAARATAEAIDWEAVVSTFEDLLSTCANGNAP